MNDIDAVTELPVTFENGLNIQEELIINNKKQWLLAYRTNYEDIKSKKVMSMCGPYAMLGGYGISSHNEVRQSFELPQHTYVKISANYHFIDFWNGETGYLKVNF